MDDGVKDGIIGNALACKFEASELVCKGQKSERCLISSQVEAVKLLYSGPMNSKGEMISTGGFLPGSELLWGESWPRNFLEDFFKYGMANYSASHNWKYTDFNFDYDYKRFGLTPWSENANPDLRTFKEAGGKLIVYHGGNDTVDLPGAVTDYYEAVERSMRGRKVAQSFFRLFVVPGMNHCTLGDGPFAVDYLSYLETWVEKGRAPDKMIGSHVKVDDLMDKAMKGDQEAWHILEQRLRFPLNPSTVEFSRPIYPYPTQAKYLGRGDPNDAASFGPLSP